VSIWPESFTELRGRWPDLPGPGLAAMFDTLPPRVHERIWDELKRQADLRIDGELIYERRLCEEWPPPPKRHAPSHGTATSTSTRRGRVQFPDHGDPLKSIPADVYLPILTGEVVSASGRTRCPMRDHPDEHPSAKAYGTRWVCFSCGAKGGIIEAAAEAYGVEPMGSGYLKLRDRIVRDLLLAPLPSEGV
jgi:hypothetical protein